MSDVTFSIEPDTGSQNSGRPDRALPRTRRWPFRFARPGFLGDVHVAGLGVRDMVCNVTATTLGLVSIYGLADAIQHGNVYTFLKGDGGSRVAIGEEPVLFLVSVVGMGMSVAVALVLFFRDDAR
ncbi:hypothetical protein [Jiella sonneratiae]|uniref:Uncharacterized protein n=1 Tax=Jiella sonneratiae TaxID=2816856 RepID=A0ABS3J2W8_9HYPH|nr:hypothetical protein [Jiella sonneratiae]MBO0904021.1 hypothetical protein [Jiella sonneratiae]